jgi:hypothetical protein
MVTSSIIVPFHCTKHMLLLHQANKALWLHYLPTYQAVLLHWDYLIRTIGQRKPSPSHHPTIALYTPVVLPKCTDAKVPAQKKQKWSWQIARKNMALEDSWYLGFPKQKIFSTVFWPECEPAPTSSPCRMNGWMNDVWTENAFSLYSCPRTNHSGYLCN